MHTPKGPGRRDTDETEAARAAREADDLALIHARELVIRWRGLYATQLERLRGARKRARAWHKVEPTLLDDQIIEDVKLAAAAAGDFQALPICDLEFAAAYGLQVHPAVFWGQTNIASIEHSIVAESRGSGRK